MFIARLWIFVALALGAPLAGGYAQGQDWELLLAGGLVIDGSGAPARAGDVAFAEGRIAGIGELDPARAERVLDVSGLVVAPGFIDAHSHALGGLRDPERREAHALLHQGVTTVVLNPDGGGPHDLAALGAELEAGGIGVHAALLVQRSISVLCDAAFDAHFHVE